MKVRENIEQLSKIGPAIVAIGFFDGVHRGHQVVIQSLLNLAAEYRAAAWAVTFDPHPLEVIAPDRAPRLLTCLAHKLRILQSLGVHGAVKLRFDDRLRNLSAEAFIHTLLQIPRLKGVVVGENWRFGFHGTGNAPLLAETARQRDLVVSVVPSEKHRGSPISSTRIRSAVRTGDLAEAASMLGRPYSILGRVVPGHRVGRKLGWPTANIKPENEVHPPNGVYAAWVLGRNALFPAAAYIGSAPTFHFTDRTWIVEVYLLDQELDLYGEELEVFLLSAVRPERVFSSAGELSAQIDRDIQEIRRRLAENPPALVFQSWRSYLGLSGVQL